MLFRSAVLATFVASAAATKSITPEGSIPADSKFGKKLMEKVLKSRGLENNQEQDSSWLVNYDIKYTGCSSLPQLRAEGQGGGDDGGLLYSQNLVKFVVVPAGECSSSSSGDAQYVVNMMEFVDIYTEMKMDEKEQACENIREYCYCDNANDDEVCENQCYVDAGMEECIEYEGGDEFEVQRYLECAELEGGNNNNNNNNGNYNYNNNNNNNGVDMYRQYYVGPTCSEKDGKTINLAVFFDSGCTSKAGSGVWEAFNYGSSLPFESESLVTVGDCISCIQQDNDNNNNNGNNNNNNNNNNVEIAEICEQTYEMAVKCEENLSTGSNYFYPDSSGCNYINSILPKMEKATRKVTTASASSGSGGAAVAFAVIFFISSCILGAYSFFLYRKIHRAKVNLAQSEMTIA